MERDSIPPLIRSSLAEICMLFCPISLFHINYGWWTFAISSTCSWLGLPFFWAWINNKCVASFRDVLSYPIYSIVFECLVISLIKERFLVFSFFPMIKYLICSFWNNLAGTNELCMYLKQFFNLFYCGLRKTKSLIVSYHLSRYIPWN